MDPLALLVKLAFLFVGLFLAEKLTRPPLSFILGKIAQAAEDFAAVLGKQLMPAFKRATDAINDLKWQLAMIDKEWRSNGRLD